MAPRSARIFAWRPTSLRDTGFGEWAMVSTTYSGLFQHDCTARVYASHLNPGPTPRAPTHEAGSATRRYITPVSVDPRTVDVPRLNPVRASVEGVLGRLAAGMTTESAAE